RARPGTGVRLGRATRGRWASRPAPGRTRPASARRRTGSPDGHGEQSGARGAHPSGPPQRRRSIHYQPSGLLTDAIIKTLYTYGPFDTMHVILSFAAPGGPSKRAAPTTGGNGVTVDGRVSLDVRRSRRRPPVGPHARRFAPHRRRRASRSGRARGRRPRPGPAEVV